MENGPIIDGLPIKMVIFNSFFSAMVSIAMGYVSLNRFTMINLLLVGGFNHL